MFKNVGIRKSTIKTIFASLKSNKKENEKEKDKVK